MNLRCSVGRLCTRRTVLPVSVVMWLPETLRLYFFFFHGKLVLSVAVSTSDRQASRLAAFLQAEDRPMSKGLKSDSTACRHVCLGRPTGRLQSDGGFWIAAGTVRLPGYYYYRVLRAMLSAS